MNRSEFEERLHACLDARTDPFDDGELVAWLDAHPEELDAMARLWASVCMLQAPAAAVGSHGSPEATVAASASPAPALGAARGRSLRSRRLPWFVLGAGLAGVAAVLVLAAIAAVPTAPPAAGRILSAVVESITPTLGLAPQVRATEVLVARPDVRVEVFTQWSVR